MGQKNPYEILGVTSSTSTEEIKVAYRNLVKRYHPDKYPTYLQKAWATKKMQEINEAYAVLRDPLRRNQYDKNQAASFSTPGRRPADRPPRAPSPRTRQGKQKSAQHSTARPTLPDWFGYIFVLGWFFLWAILASGFSVFVISIIGIFLLVALACGFYGVDLFYKHFSLTSQHPWRDLAIRLAMLVAIVVLLLYPAYRAGVPPWLVFVALFAVFPGGWIALAGILTLLSETVALFLYIYRAGKVTETTEVLFRE